MYERIAEVMKILNNFYTELEKVTNDTKNGIIESQHAIPWAIGYVVVAVVVCAGTFFVAGPWGIGLICVPAFGVVAYSIQSFFSLGKTNEQLNQLQKDTRRLSLESAKHRAQLQVILALMKGKLNYSLPGYGV